jgi:hypothetical protein
VAWQSPTAGGDVDPYAQRLGPNGNTSWSSPVDFFPEASDYNAQAMIGDGSGGIVAVIAQRACCGPAYLQRVDGSGALPWGNTGVPLSNVAIMDQSYSLFLDGNGGVYCAWAEDRDGGWNVYLQRFNLTDGSWGNPVAVAISSFDARVENGSVKLSATFRSDMTVDRLAVYRGAGNEPMQLLASMVPAQQTRFVYTDKSVAPGTYRYQIGVSDSDGEFVSPVETVTVPALEAALEQNQPNPFNPATTIRFTVPSRTDATLAIYDAEGRTVRTLLDGTVPAGITSVEWDGRDDSGAIVTSGVYFYRLTAGKFTASRKMLLLK